MSRKYGTFFLSAYDSKSEKGGRWDTTFLLMFDSRSFVTFHRFPNRFLTA